MFHLQSFMLSHVHVCVYLHVLRCGCRCQVAFSMSLGIIFGGIFFFFLINPYFPDSDRLAGQHQESFYLSISTSIAIIDCSSSESHCTLWVPSPHDHEMNLYFLAKAENAWKQVSSSFFLLACAIYWIIPSPRSHGMGSWHPLWLHLKIRPSWK